METTITTIPCRTDRGWDIDTYIVTVIDPRGRTVMTFHTTNKEEAETIGPQLIEFLGY